MDLGLPLRKRCGPYLWGLHLILMDWASTFCRKACLVHVRMPEISAGVGSPACIKWSWFGIDFTDRLMITAIVLWYHHFRSTSGSKNVGMKLLQTTTLQLAGADWSCRRILLLAGAEEAIQQRRGDLLRDLTAEQQAGKPIMCCYSQS